MSRANILRIVIAAIMGAISALGGAQVMSEPSAPAPCPQAPAAAE